MASEALPRAAAQRAIELEASHTAGSRAAAIHGQRAALASLLSAMVNQQGSDVTEGEGRHDRDERLLVELACLGPSLHASVPNDLPRPLSRFVRRGIRVRIAGPLAD
jgi:hypothetical protein